MEPLLEQAEMNTDITPNGTIYQRHKNDSGSSSDEEFSDLDLRGEIGSSEPYQSHPLKKNYAYILSFIPRPKIYHAYFIASFIMLLYLVGGSTFRFHFHFFQSNQNDELLFFNVPNGKPLAPLSSVKYPKKGPVIATLVTNSTKDVNDLISAIQSLAFLQGDDSKHPAPVLIFNEGDLTKEQVRSLVSSTHKPVAFPIVDLTTFPKGFKSNQEDGGPQFHVKNRKPWGYYQMIRFWVTGIWKHPALQGFETVMRIDSDSCFKSQNEYLPNFAHDRLVYHSQFVGYEAHGDMFVKGLYVFVHKYVQDHNLRPKNPLLWQFISTTWEAKTKLPLYNTNFEVARKSFMQRKEVMEFHESLTERPPFGVLNHRWGDAVIRMFTTALFANDEYVMQSAPEGYYHKDRCDHNEVKTALTAQLEQMKN